MYGKSSKSKPKPTNQVVVNISTTKYGVFPAVIQSLGYLPSRQDDIHWDVYWSDKTRGMEEIIRKAKFYQKVNHFPKMDEIYTKSNLAKSLQKMQMMLENTTLKDEYNFFPMTWELPQNYDEIMKYFNKTKNSCVILKPCSGAQGCGIYLAYSKEYIRPDSEYIVQVYIHNPLLINGYKFDLRIYVLIISCDPLRIYIYKDGLVRLCTVKYAPPTPNNIENTYMHLTNYALNKDSSEYIPNTEQNENESSKRSLQWFWTYLQEIHKKSRHDIDNLWNQITDIVIKTLISIQPILSSSIKSYKVHSKNDNPFTCFELLGFDILLTDTFQPILLEVNHSPSFHVESPIDATVKIPLLQQTLTLLQINPNDKIYYYNYHIKKTQNRLYGDIYDTSNSSAYNHNVKQSHSFHEYFQQLTPENAWKQFLEKEVSLLNGYQLIYPLDTSTSSSINPMDNSMNRKLLQEKLERQYRYDTILKYNQIAYQNTILQKLNIKRPGDSQSSLLMSMSAASGMPYILNCSNSNNTDSNSSSRVPKNYIQEFLQQQQQVTSPINTTSSPSQMISNQSNTTSSRAISTLVHTNIGHLNKIDIGQDREEEEKDVLLMLNSSPISTYITKSISPKSSMNGTPNSRNNLSNLSNTRHKYNQMISSYSHPLPTADTVPTTNSKDTPNTPITNLDGMNNTMSIHRNQISPKNNILQIRGSPNSQTKIAIHNFSPDLLNQSPNTQDINVPRLQSSEIKSPSHFKSPHTVSASTTINTMTSQDATTSGTDNNINRNNVMVPQPPSSFAPSSSSFRSNNRSQVFPSASISAGASASVTASATNAPTPGNISHSIVSSITAGTDTTSVTMINIEQFNTISTPTNGEQRRLSKVDISLPSSINQGVTDQAVYEQYMYQQQHYLYQTMKKSSHIHMDNGNEKLSVGNTVLINPSVGLIIPPNSDKVISTVPLPNTIPLQIPSSAKNDNTIPSSVHLVPIVTHNDSDLDVNMVNNNVLVLNQSTDGTPQILARTTTTTTAVMKQKSISTNQVLTTSQFSELLPDKNQYSSNKNNQNNQAVSSSSKNNIEILDKSNSNVINTTISPTMITGITRVDKIEINSSIGSSKSMKRGSQVRFQIHQQQQSLVQATDNTSNNSMNTNIINKPNNSNEQNMNKSISNKDSSNDNNTNNGSQSGNKSITSNTNKSNINNKRSNKSHPTSTTTMSKKEEDALILQEILNELQLEQEQQREQNKEKDIDIESETDEEILKNFDKSKHIPTWQKWNAMKQQYQS